VNAPIYPAWEEIIRIDDEGFVGVLLRPVHPNMPQHIKYKIFTPHGFPAFSDPGELTFAPIDSADTGADMAEAEQHLHQLLALAKSQ